MHTCSDTVMPPLTRRDSITQFSVLSYKGRMWEKDWQRGERDILDIRRQAVRVIFNLPWHKSYKTVTVTKSMSNRLSQCPPTPKHSACSWAQIMSESTEGCRKSMGSQRPSKDGAKFRSTAKPTKLQNKAKQLAQRVAVLSVCPSVWLSACQDARMPFRLALISKSSACDGYQWHFRSEPSLVCRPPPRQVSQLFIFYLVVVVEKFSLKFRCVLKWSCQRM